MNVDKWFQIFMTQRILLWQCTSATVQKGDTPGHQTNQTDSFGNTNRIMSSSRQLPSESEFSETVYCTKWMRYRNIRVQQEQHTTQSRMNIKWSMPWLGSQILAHCVCFHAPGPSRNKTLAYDWAIVSAGPPKTPGINGCRTEISFLGLFNVHEGGEYNSLDSVCATNSSHSHQRGNAGQ